MDTVETICAPATASGGALDLIRLSGPDAVRAAAAVFFPRNGKNFAFCKPRVATFGEIRENDRVIDEVIALIFRGPFSYTGEDCVEISCHGSSYIVDKIISLLIAQDGVRMARPGEFTERAFLNGKMDLSQAEAVADIIEARSELYNRIAIDQLRGGITKAVDDIHESILRLNAMIELSLDFSDHDDLEFASRDELLEGTDKVISKIDRLLSSFSEGNMIRNGIPVAIVGKPNVGKSTLMNTLLHDDRAIVSARPGTTRDTIEEKIYIKGQEYRLIDTAGIRESEDDIERAGITRALEKIKRARILVVLVSPQSIKEDLNVLSGIKTDANLIVAINKADLITSESEMSLKKEKCEEFLSQNGYRAKICIISAKKDMGIEDLKEAVSSTIPVREKNCGNDTVIVSRRHYDVLSKAFYKLKEMRQEVEEGTEPEILSLYLRDADNSLMEIGGGTTSEEVLNSIFSHFCIGK